MDMTFNEKVPFIVFSIVNLIVTSSSSFLTFYSIQYFNLYGLFYVIPFILDIHYLNQFGSFHLELELLLIPAIGCTSI